LCLRTAFGACSPRCRGFDISFASLDCALNETSSIDFELRGEHITLDALLKATGLVASGGNAKALIAAGSVIVNGQPETRRGRKLRPGDVVVLAGQRITIAPAQQTQPGAGDRGG
jgi:ribosome-associated protein